VAVVGTAAGAQLDSSPGLHRLKIGLGPGGDCPPAVAVHTDKFDLVGLDVSFDDRAAAATENAAPFGDIVNLVQDLEHHLRIFDELVMSHLADDAVELPLLVGDSLLDRLSVPAKAKLEVGGRAVNLVDPTLPELLHVDAYYMIGLTDHAGNIEKVLTVAHAGYGSLVLTAGAHQFAADCPLQSEAGKVVHLDFATARTIQRQRGNGIDEHIDPPLLSTSPIEIIFLPEPAKTAATLYHIKNKAAPKSSSEPVSSSLAN
jgi:hypothetical protein